MPALMEVLRHDVGVAQLVEVAPHDLPVAGHHARRAASPPLRVERKREPVIAQGGEADGRVVWRSLAHLVGIEIGRVGEVQHGTP
jgi:hypothetical protein